MALTTLEVIDFIAMRPRHLDKNAFFGQWICYMQQIDGGASVTLPPHTSTAYPCEPAPS
jgi:hypothetical protein